VWAGVVVRIILVVWRQRPSESSQPIRAVSKVQFGCIGGQWLVGILDRFAFGFRVCALWPWSPRGPDRAARLDDRKIRPGPGQGDAERVPQRMGVRVGHLSLAPVVAEDRAQPGRGQSLPAVRSLFDGQRGGWTLLDEWIDTGCQLRRNCQFDDPCRLGGGGLPARRSRDRVLVTSPRRRLNS
jgi:hypothetical protein